MPLMRSPEGEERDIPDAGVVALERLGWERVETRPPAKRAPRKRPAADE